MFKSDTIKDNGGDTSEVLNMKAAREEAEMVMFDCMSQVLKANKLDAADIDVLIINCWRKIVFFFNLWKKRNKG